MVRTKTFRTGTVALGIVLATSACGPSSHDIAVLGSESSARPVPEVIQSNQQFADGSARYLGQIDDHSYFVARPASGSDHEACLIQVGSAADDWIGGCSTIQRDKIVMLSGGGPRQQVALVSDDPSADSLEEAGWEKQADNLWSRSS